MSDQTVYDEIYDTEGKLVSRTPRLASPMVSRADVKTLRQDLRAIKDLTAASPAQAPLVAAVKTLARAILALSWYDIQNDPVDVPISHSRKLDPDGNDIPE